MEDQTKSNIISESKVPEVTLGFWIIKIAATTLGETGGDTVTMTLNWGYLAGTCLFLAAMIVLVAAQVRARKFHPALYWATIVASTTFGTTMADFADRCCSLVSCWCSASGIAPRERSRSTASAHRALRRSIGARSPFRKRWVLRSATGSRIPAIWAIAAAH